jgi:CRISPR-associated protein Csm3
MATTLKLKKHVLFQGTLTCRSGLRIGGTEVGIEIGGAENPVIKDPQGRPYVPGSSLKGKLRAMLEYKYNRVGANGEPCGCKRPLAECPVCTLFGPHKQPEHDLGPTRIIVRDAMLTPEWLQRWEDARAQGAEFTETKTETMVDRRTGVAARGSLRTQERVPAGAEFRVEVVLRVFEGDDEDRMKRYVLEALDLVSKDYLGGSGTRGYGWVEIKDIKVTDS